ncbi:MAG: LysE family translocator [Paracoccaceae bacterium]|nr:LysE family translocator [Paracoccaceae bacterium]MDE2913575.1 LysE family translocator [Paracoccaceae bacterium]
MPLGLDPLYLFLIVGMASPGPNVILLATFGARFGFRATLSHMLGVVIGVSIIGAAAGLGIASILISFPELQLAARIGAAIWIVWMAWGLYRSEIHGSADDRARPFSLGEAVLFQWVNPKIWAVALAAMAGFSKGLTPVEEAVRLATAFGSVNLAVCILWTATGSYLRRFLTTPADWRVFMGTMAFCLAASAGMVFL